MTHAYDESYLKDAMRNIGILAHFCINEYGLSPEEFQEAFLNSRVSKQISKGNPRYLVGYSGKELADIIIPESKVSSNNKELYELTPEYWAGWILTYYQWYTSLDFATIKSRGLTFAKILKMYNPLHEADLSKFIEIATKTLIS